MTGFRLYPTSDAEHYQLMILNEFIVNPTNFAYCMMLSRITNKSVLYYIMLLVLHSAYLHFPE